jgi:TRAP-type C4-dicarboxylate transport system substrate-binding protein
MIKHDRSLAPLIALLCLLCAAFNVHALTLKIATIAPAGTSWMKEMKKGAEEIKEKTSGRVKIKFYPGGVMGNDASVHRKIRINQLHGGAFSASGLSQVDPAIQLYSLPMLFNSFDEVDHVRNIMDNKVKQAIANKGFVLLGITEGGFGRILSNSPVNNLETIRQTKVWTPEGDQLSTITMDALGIQPIALPLSDVFTGLQTGLIETITSTSAGAIAFQWHTRVNYLVDVPVMYLIGTLAVSQKAFNKIKTEDRDIVIEEMNRVFDRLETINRKDNLGATAALKTQGLEAIQPDPAEIDRWRELSAQSIQQMLDQGTIDGDLYAEIKNLLEQFRQTQ